MTTADDARADHDASFDPGTDFRFSPRPNTADAIAWRPWGDDAFSEARASGRPILLAISAVWCHWCHVMDETTYSDPAVQDAIGAGFVPIRVDNDRRPDVNRRYNMGGWPTIAFLTPAGRVLTGATYLNAAQLLPVLRRVRDYYAEHRVELEEPVSGPGPTPASRLGRGVATTEPTVAGIAGDGGPDERPAGDGLDAAGAAAVCEATAGLYDPRYGGLGSEPKFPQPDAVRLLLTAGLRHDDERLLAMATHSLDAMVHGGLYDPVEDGFFRYATRRDWTVPHYEKMLEDNARLALLYLDAHAWTGRAGYADAAASVIRYLHGTLYDESNGVFWGSQDADEHYYAYDAAGRGAVGHRPAVDRTAFVDWNALAARALVRAATLLERPGLLTTALATLDVLWREGRSRGGLRHYLGGPVSGLLTDQAAATAALLDAYEATGDNTWLARAGLLADWTLEHLRDDEGRFTDRPRVPGEGERAPRGGPADNSAPDRPLPVLDGGAEMADALTRLAAFTGTPAYREDAVEALAAYAPEATAAGPFAAPWALAVMRLVEHPARIVLIGRAGDAQAGALLRAGLRVPEPLLSVQLLDPEADAEAIVRDGYAVPDAGSAAAFVCLAGVCLEPTSDPDRLAELVRRAPVD